MGAFSPFPGDADRDDATDRRLERGALGLEGARGGRPPRADEWAVAADSSALPKADHATGKPTAPAKAPGREVLDLADWCPMARSPVRPLWPLESRLAAIRRVDGRIERVKQRLLQHLNEAGELDWDLWCVDGTSIRASRAAVGGGKGGAAKNRSTTHSAAHEEGGEASSTW